MQTPSGSGAPDPDGSVSVAATGAVKGWGMKVERIKGIYTY